MPFIINRPGQSPLFGLSPEFSLKGSETLFLRMRITVSWELHNAYNLQHIDRPADLSDCLPAQLAVAYGSGT